MKRILIMAGGTGGHVFPGLVVAHYFRSQGIDVHWLGTSQGLEARLVPDHFPLHLISIRGLRGKGWRSWCLAPVKILAAIWQAKHIIQTLQPDVVIGMGGFVSGPGGIAAWWERAVLVIHEQNAVAGLTNKILTRFAKKILTGFPHVFNHSQKNKVTLIGNPVRPELEQFPHPDERFLKRLASQPLHLLILGGSLGAEAINQLIPVVLSKLPIAKRPHIMHQTGEKHYVKTLEAYAAAGVTVNMTDIKVLPFIEDMPAAYHFADMVLCRAGALTIAELCAVGIGSILIPFPYAVDDHQTVNAQFMVKSGASLCIPQTELTVENLLEKINYFTMQPEKQLAMAKAAYELRQLSAAEKMFNLLAEG
jgi:UDP-N-acetylglucosamine--N-acetylmuramyl-(pentapeptide) pyrophosphoryl-undecaprenol N-acetylglucosamine transferase